jgi:hypothetical protein
MNMKMLVVSVLLSVLVCASALALTPLGTPTASLKTGQFRLGFDFATGEQDIEADWGDGYKETWKDVQTNFYAANIGYGICDDWEIFTRLGTANVDFDDYEVDGVSYDDYDFGGDYGFMFGFGTKVTFAKTGNLNLGALVQIHWINSEESWSWMEDTTSFESTEEIDMYEIQVAVGPTWKVNEALSIYGGPFFYFLSGDDDWDYSVDGVPTDSDSADLEEESSFGGYVGAQYDLNTNASIYAEYQLTNDAWVFAAGFAWKI